MIKHGSKGEILSKDMKEMTSALTRPSEVKVTKMSPADCIRNGVSIDKAREMSISELTREDAELLLNHGISKHGLSKLYNAKDGSMYPKLTKWGLHHPGAAMSAKQRMDAFENDKPVLPAPPPDTVECPRCHANFKRVELINTHDRGMMCLNCYDEVNKPEATPVVSQLSETIKPLSKTIKPFTEIAEQLQEIMHGDIKDTGARTEFDTGAVRDMHEGKGRHG